VVRNPVSPAQVRSLEGRIRALPSSPGQPEQSRAEPRSPQEATPVWMLARPEPRLDWSASRARRSGRAGGYRATHPLPEPARLSQREPEAAPAEWKSRRALVPWRFRQAQRGLPAQRRAIGWSALSGSGPFSSF